MKIRQAEFYQRNQFSDNSRFKYVDFETAVPTALQEAGCKPFNLRIPVERGWGKSDFRLLIVVQHVDTADLKSKELCSDTYGTVITNLMRQATSWFYDLTGKRRQFSTAVVNFNCARTYHLDGANYGRMLAISAQRVTEAIDWLDPTHVLVLGDEAAATLRKVDTAVVLQQRGWAHKLGDTNLVHSIDASRCYDVGGGGDSDDDDGDQGASDRTLVAKANLLGFICRQMLTLWFDKLPFHVRKLAPKVRVVDTVTRFDKLMGLLDSATAVAVDTETSNLSVLDNKLLVVQFAVGPDVGYVLPVDHPDAPWTSKERAMIKDRLREFFRQPIQLCVYDLYKQRYLIGHNFKYDLRVLRKQLGIPVIHWPVWDTMAGCFCLDENTTSLRTFGVPYGNLAQLMCHYGNDFYLTKDGFSKEDRTDVENQDFYDPTFLDYCAIDVQGPFAIHLQQQKEADTQRMCLTDSYGDTYRRFMLVQMSNIIHDFSHMEQVGVTIDMPYLLSLLSPDSVLNKRIDEAKAEFYALPNVKKANKQIAKDQKVQQNGLFGKVDSWVFDISKADHLITLFFDVMDLDIVTVGKATAAWPQGVPGLGKEFQSAYKKDHPEVALLERIRKMEKLRSSYVEAFYRKVSESADGRIDGRLRPGFGFFDVVTGRSNSFNPSLQQIPQRTAEAKFIKRMFIAASGKLIVKLDYSAHEVRCWSYAGQDKKLGNLFKIGRNLRIQYMETGDASLPARIKLEGDLHRINVKRFFRVDLKTVASELLEQLRDRVKAIVFGAIYGRSVKSIAKAAGMTLEEAQEAYDMFFAEYNVAGKWLKWAMDVSRTFLHVHSFIGRKRNLWGYLTGVNQIIAANERQSTNSPIQGVAADLAHTANRVFTLEWLKLCQKFGWVDDTSTDLPSLVEVMVHDSSRGEVEFDKVMAMVQCLNWSYTTGTEKYLKDVFGVNLTCPLEVEFEIGPDESHMLKWDYSWDGLRRILRSSLETMKADGIDPDLDVDAAFDTVYTQWENGKVRKHCDKLYPWWSSSMSAAEKQAA